ncbi:MAG: carbohydrate ABC transporter permease [Spirochaetales bacterium]|nr:carbohydrate ABC transporter permease [Spirochaetales bacterium]
MVAISGERRSRWTIGLILILLGLVVAYPLYYTFMVSVSQYKDILNGGLLILPQEWSFSAYSLIFKLIDIGPAFLVSLLVTVVGTGVNMMVSVSGAYALSKKELPGHRIFLLILIVAMLFEGGLVPYYLTVKKLGLVNSFWVMVFPVALNFFYMFILINHFRQLPASLEESAYLDGANEITVLIRILLPISVPVLSAIGLFYAVDRWNEWWHAMIFLIDEELFPLQLILRRLLSTMDQMVSESASAGLADQFGALFTPGIKMAAVVITTIPIMLVYPFLQRYFAKGIMVGSLKG